VIVLIPAVTAELIAVSLTVLVLATLRAVVTASLIVLVTICALTMAVRVIVAL